MKRIALLVLIIGFLLLSACGAPSAPPTETLPTPPPTEQPTPTLTPTEPEATPAKFVVTNLQAIPNPDAKYGYSVNVEIENIGDSKGVYELKSKVDNKDMEPVEVELGPGEKKTITLSEAESEIGFLAMMYKIDEEKKHEIGKEHIISVDSSSVTVTFVEPTPPAKPEIKGVTTYFDRGYFYIVGEVLNATNSNIDFMKVVATFYNETGAVIGTSFTYTELDIILPNDAAPFEISSYPDKIQPASYKLSGDYNTTSEQLFAGLDIKSHSASISREYHEIVGEVENTSTMPAEFVKVVATYYNSNGDVIGTAFTYTDIDVVEARGTAPFKLSSYPRKISPASYKLQVQGRKH